MNLNQEIEPTILYENFNGKFMCFKNEAFINRFLSTGDFEPHHLQLTKNIIKPDDIVIDAGANLGYHTVALSKLVGKNGKVISFEPLKKVFNQLKTNCELNDLKNVKLFNMAISNINQTVQMDPISFTDEFVNNIGATKVGQGGDVVEAITLDSLNLDSLSFIKIDIQGCELKFLQGAKNTIKKFRPIMIIEVENQWLQCFGTNSEELLNEFLKMKYIIIRINDSYPCDHLLIPNEREEEVYEITKDLKYPFDVIKGNKIKLNWDREINQSILYGSFTIVE